MKIASHHVSEAEGQRPLFQRSILVLSACSGLGLVLLLTSMVFLSWLDFQRMVPVREHLRLYDELEGVALRWEYMLLRRPADRGFAIDAALAALTRKLERRAGSAKHLEVETAKRLLQLTQLFARIAKQDTSDPASALQALLRLREAIKQETQTLRATLDDRFGEARQLWQVSAALSTLLVAFTGVGLFTAYLRLLRPLRNLAHLERQPGHGWKSRGHPCLGQTPRGVLIYRNPRQWTGFSSRAFEPRATRLFFAAAGRHRARPRLGAAPGERSRGSIDAAKRGTSRRVCEPGNALRGDRT